MILIYILFMMILATFATYEEENDNKPFVITPRIIPTHKETPSKLLKRQPTFFRLPKITEMQTTPNNSRPSSSLTLNSMSTSKTGNLDENRRYGLFPLFTASKKGKFSEVMNLVSSPENDIHKTTSLGETSLFAACESGHLEIATALIKRGAKISQARGDGATPLFIAAKEGHVDIVNYLRNWGADLDTPNKWGVTPLLIASEKGHVKVVKALVERHGADIRITKPDGSTALMMACQENRLKVVRFLIFATESEVNAEDNDGWSPLLLAAYAGHTELVEFLLSNGAKINHCSKSGTSAIFCAVFYGYFKILKILVRRGANLEVVRYSSLKILVRRGANLEVERGYSLTPLTAAILYERTEIAEYLLKHEADDGTTRDFLYDRNLARFVPSLEILCSKLFPSGELDGGELDWYYNNDCEDTDSTNTY